MDHYQASTEIDKSDGKADVLVKSITEEF